ncbi:nascent polypeptide-associated complex subunit alpha, muscle-specific form-like isoform X1 [Amphibalanus amphitrite]|uniref:nascent polypeptide-associated complex subunit alpha, muscle-specific form-like isoform X1 n=1 Tax=Amphibalanus amphitrite TaxID=1232801 RepID=UPI001C92A95E|nr:nascent polypeptide-associated complex subunit alpha, muscle-specific form-like isoform X1 [Amphibalanus amphitrite]XP_043204784.1 nascent polypeptide-associated complex subunit alpha, muscle-specific form-like isoform X1 [Amphibalanus amphitrite]
MGESDITAECVSALSSCLSHYDGTPVCEARTSPVCELLEKAALRLTDTDPALAQPSAADLLAPAADLLRLHLACHGTARVAARPGREWPVNVDVSGERVRLVPRPERRAHTAYTTEPVLEWHQVLAVRPAPAAGSTSTEKGGSTSKTTGSHEAKSPRCADSTAATRASAASDVATPVANFSRGLRLLREKYKLGAPSPSPETRSSPGNRPESTSDVTTPKSSGKQASRANLSTRSATNLTLAPTPELKATTKRVSFGSGCGSPAGSGPAANSRARSRSRSRNQPADLLSRRGRSASLAAGRARGVPNRVPRARATPEPPPPPPPRLVRAVSVAAGGDLWCTTSADWEHQLRTISARAEAATAAAADKRPETLLYGQLVIHHNCVLPELPRFVRCLSLQRRAAEPVLVWLCDAARALLVPRCTLLSACSDGLQLYRQPPLLVLLTGKRLPLVVPARLVAACLSLLAGSLPWLTAPEPARRLAHSGLAVLAAEVGSPEALELLTRMARHPATAPPLRAAEVVAPLADLAGDQLDPPEPDEAQLCRLVRLLRAAVGAGMSDPGRSLLAGSPLLHGLLRLAKGPRLELEVRRLVSRLQENDTPAEGPTGPAAASTPRQLPAAPGSAGLSRRVRPAGPPRRAQSSTPGTQTSAADTARSAGAAAAPARPRLPGASAAAAAAVVRRPPPLLPTPPDPAPPVAPGRLVRLNEEELRADGGADGRPPPETDAAPARPPASVIEYLRRGQRCRLRTSLCLQLEDVRRVQDMGQQRLAMLLCGLLNAGAGGAIYYGVSADGRVNGLQLDGGHRDRLRLGVDKVVSHLLEPAVPSDCVRLQFVPVLESGQSARDLRLSSHTLFVVVVHCLSPPREVFLVRSQLTAFLRRAGPAGEPQTAPLSLPQLRQLVAAQEMALVSGRQAALESATACLRRLLAPAPAACGDCGGTKPATADWRRQVAASGEDRSGGWTD